MRTPCSNAARMLQVVAVGGAFVLTFALMPGLRADADSAAESRSLVNSARSAAGLAPLAADSGLDSIAGAQAARMAQRDAIYHNPNLQADADAAGVNWTLIGENVGVGDDVASVHEAFMASPGHRDNVVFAGYTSIGVGVAVGGDGSIFVAHAFAEVIPASQPMQPQAPAPAAESQPVTETPAQAPQAEPAAPAVVEAPEPAPIAIIGGVVNL